MLKQFVKKLPVFHQTETQKQFFAATFDQLFNPANVEQAQGFIGRRPGGVLDAENDIYIQEPNKSRRVYQLEPIAYVKDPNTLEDTNHVFYEDFINRLNFYGTDVSNHDRLFSDTYYSFAPPIDIDKFLNFSNYVWIEDEIPPVYIQFSGTQTAYTAVIENQILGQAQFNTSDAPGMQPSNFQFTSGVRVVFEGSVDYTGAYTIENVGTSMRLVRALTVQIPSSLVGTIPWDFGGISPWDELPWDSAGVDVRPPQKDYITIERGACNGNSWSRTNRWYHIEAINRLQAVGQVIDATLIAGGAGYSVDDIIVVEGDGTGADIRVTGVDGFGTITSFVIRNRGQGYSFAFIDDTGAVPLPGGSPWSPPGITDYSQWDTFDWDTPLVPSSGTDAIFDIELASAIDRRNRAERPILEYRRGLELFNHGTKFVGEVDLVAETEALGDIIGQANYNLDGIPLFDGALIIFLNPSTIPSFLPWDETPDAGPGSMTYWDTGPFDAQGIAAATTRFVWQVSGVGTSITLERFNLATNMVDPAVPAAELGDSVLVRNGFLYSGYPFYQVEDSILSQTWKQGQTKITPNTHPLYQLYDYRGIPLNDTLEFENSDFTGNEIFSYRVYQGEALEPNTFTQFDTVLGFETLRKGLGQVSDLVFENDLETERSTSRPSGQPRTEIPGYYFFREMGFDAACNVIGEEYATNWLPAKEPDKQRVIDQFFTETDGEISFVLTSGAVNDDVYVNVNGVRLGDDQYSYDPIEETVTLSVGQPVGTIVEIYTYTHGPVTDSDFGFFEIPSGLENNPNNIEIALNSWNEFANHFVSIIENQTPFFGAAFGVSNNYRDSAKDGSVGRFILQNQAPLLKSMFVTSSEPLDVVEAMRMSSREYTRYKNKFIKIGGQLINEGYTPFNAGDQIPVNQWVDEAIRRILRTREFANAFEDTYMAAWNNVYEEEALAGDNSSTILTVTNFIDLEDKKNAMYIYIDGELLLIDRDYKIVNLNPIRIEFATPPLIGNNVLVRLYEDVTPAHIPATPSKLGIYPVYLPRIETDTSYATPVDVLVGHDGSRTPLYGEYISGQLTDPRDEMLLELEKRIYNGVVETFRGEYNPAVRLEDVAPGAFRTTRWERSEYEAVLRQSFYKWAMQMRADFRVNDSFDNSDEWSWNYSSINDKNGDPLPGYWRGIFDHYYDTQTPHLTPWEMLGFNKEPEWWSDEYSPGPWTASHPMWVDIENGVIRQGPRAGVDERFARPGLVASYLPVTGGVGGGNLKATPMECIGYVGPLPTVDEASAEWTYGDYGPVEYAWRTSEAYPFAVSETMFLTRPASFGEKLFNPENFLVTPINDLQVVSRRDNILKRIGNSIQTVHGEFRDGKKVLNTGYQVWISSRLKMLGLDVGLEFGDKLRTLDVKLGHKMAGFTDRNSLRMFVEGVSATSTTSNLLVPLENIDVRLFTGAPVREYFYGGVLVKANADGTYQVYGYDVLKGTFTYFERKQSPQDRNVNVAGQPEAFTNYESGRTYQEGAIVRLNGLFYRALVTHEATKFIPGNWQKLSALPITGGVNVTYKPASAGTTRTIDYGHIFRNPQEVFDFLIGWGDYLEAQGWIFENLNELNNSIENWLNAGKEFLFWVGTNWQADSAIVLSPAANRTELEVKEGYPMSVEKITNGVYSILDKNGFAIDPINTKVMRSDRRIRVLPTIEGQEVYSLRVNTAETESIITFDNLTEFDDVLYDPLLGSRQVRVFINGRRTLGWTGKLEAAGYIITENGLLQNFENLVDSVRDYHNTEVLLDNPLVEATARHLIGYNEREYLNNLQVFDDAQFQFYQGQSRQKGTRQSIDKLERSRIVTDLEDTLEVYEEWALKTGEFGGIANQQMTEFLLEANTIKVDPQLVELVYPQSKFGFDGPSTAIVERIEIVSASNIWDDPPVVQIQPNPADIGGGGATAVANIDSEGRLVSIDVTNSGSGYRLPPRVSIGPVIPTEFSDRAVAILAFDITPDVAGDDIITIDIDDNDKWITKPVDIAASETQNLWPIIDEQYWNIPSAGYVHFDDVSHTIFDIRNLQDLWDRPTPPINGNRIWTAKAENKDWTVYKMIPSATLVRQFNSGDTEFRLEGVETVTLLNSGSGFSVNDEIVLPFLPGQVYPATLIVTDVDVGGEILEIEVTLDGGTYYDLSSWIGVPIGIGSGAEIAIETVTPVLFEEGLVWFDTPLPDAGPNGHSLRYLRNRVFIDGTVYDYEQIEGNLYRLSIDGEPIQDNELNGTDDFPDVTDTSVFYNLRFQNIPDWEQNGDPAIVGANPADDDTIWLDSNAREAIISLSEISGGVILNGFTVIDGGYGYTEDGTISVVLPGGGSGGVLSYTVSPQTRSIVSVSLVNAGSGYLDGLTIPLTVDAPPTGDGRWRVKKVSGITLSDHRTEGTLVNTERFDGAFIYDVITKDTITQLPVYDPFKGLIPGPADKNIRYRADRDPARYTVASDARMIRPSGAFGAANVGELWWDLSTCAYVWYEQDTDTYRRDHWGELFPGSSVDIYEWVRSAQPPAEYEGEGTVRNTTDYVQIQEWDPLLEEVRTFYYFWVKNVPVAPGIRSRSLSASEVSRLIRNPRAQLYRWYSPISQTGFIFSGVDGVFTDSDNVFQISYKRTEDDNRKHVEWELGREDDRSYRLKTSLWDKMTDSLVGFTQPVPINNSTVSGFPPLRNFNNAIPVAGNTSLGYLPVPDPALNDLNRYGIRHRPLQSMFKNRNAALRIFVQVVNELMADIRLRDEDPFWNSGMTTNNLWEWVDWYAEGYNEDNVIPTKQVANVGSLTTITDILPGEIVKVQSTQPSFYTYNFEDEQWAMVAKRDVRLQLKDIIYTNERNLPESLELRELIDTLKNRIFVQERFVFRNKLFFAMLNYVFQEQEDLDWAFKTTYIVVEQTGKRITTDRVFQIDPFDSVFQFIQESKPYQTKVRDYRITRRTEIDDLPGTVTEITRIETEADSLLSARLLYDRFRCSLSIEEMRIAKAAALADPNYDGYSYLDGGTTQIRLGAAGRFVIQQVDLLTSILTISGDTFSDFTPVEAYWDLVPWDTDTWDGAAGTSQTELIAVAEINRRLHEEFRCYFEGLFIINTDLSGTTTTQPWDSIPWDLVGWDANSEDNSIGTLEGSNEGTFDDIDPEDSFAANGAQREFNLTTTTPTYFMFVQVFDENGDLVPTTLNMDYFFIGGRVVFIEAPLNGHTVNVYTYLEAGDFINPQVSAGITEEMLPLDPRENLVIVADTVDDPETPTVSYSFRIHYDTQKEVTYMRNAASSMTTLTNAIGQNDHTIEVDDASVLAPASYENPQVAWICMERIVYHGKNDALNLLIGVQRGTRGTPKVDHDAGCKVFGFDTHEINKNAAEQYWVSPAATNVYNGTNGQWRDNADGTSIFSDTANNVFAANSDPGDALRMLTGALMGGKHIVDQIAVGSLSIVTITVPGTGYAVGDAITVPGNGTAIVGAIGNDGAVTAVTITNVGSGYGAGPETMTSAAGDGTFEATVVTNREALVLAHPAPRWSVTGRVVEVDGIEWRIDTANPGGLLASTTTAATFILAEEGDALPCCPEALT
jgi:hypothetical protein